MLDDIESEFAGEKSRGKDGPTAPIMMNIGAGENRKKVSICQTRIKLNYELFFFRF